MVHQPFGILGKGLPAQFAHRLLKCLVVVVRLRAGTANKNRFNNNLCSLEDNAYLCVVMAMRFISAQIGCDGQRFGYRWQGNRRRFKIGPLLVEECYKRHQTAMVAVKQMDSSVCADDNRRHYQTENKTSARY
jgi:hypothetical protein